MKRWKILLALCINLCCSPIAYAVTASASVSNSIAAVEQAIQLVVSIDKRVPSDVVDFDALATDFVVGRPHVSTNYQNINGTSSIKTQWRLAIAPKRSGVVTIPSFDIDGYLTQPIQLDVRESSQGARNASQEKDIIMQARLDRSELYEGETALLHLTMYLGIELQNARIQSPQGEGLEIKQIGTDKQYRILLSGRNYMGVDVTYQVTPTKAGLLRIQGAKLSGDKVTQRGSFFNDPALAIPLEKRAPDIEVTVKPKPEGISGAWLPTEKLTIIQSWQPDVSGISGSEVEMGSPIERNIELRAIGVDMLKMPRVEFSYPASVKVYNEKPEFSLEGDETLMRIKQVIIPREQGEIELPGLDIDWFNSKTHQQQRGHIDGLTLNVIADPEQEPVAAVVTTPTPAQVTPTSDVQPECPAPEAATTNSSYWMIACIGFASLWLITLFLYLTKARAVPKITQTSSNPRGNIDVPYCRRLIQSRDDIALLQYMLSIDARLYPQQIMAEIEHELKLLQASRYAKQQTSWSGDRLLQALKQLQRGVDQSEKEGLAKL